MKEVYMAVDDWDSGIDNHIFESAEDAEISAREKLILKLGKEYIKEQEEYEPGWLDRQFSIFALNFHSKGDKL